MTVGSQVDRLLRRGYLFALDQAIAQGRPGMSIIGSLLNGRYQVQELLGRGGSADVFLATDTRLNARVAVKMLHPAWVAMDIGGVERERFRREAHTVASLVHPHILPITDYADAWETFYLVMPFVAGGSLADYLRADGRLEPAKAGRYLRQIAIALDYAHRRGLVHRDVKPLNVLRDSENDHLYLADFGIAARPVRRSTSTRSGACSSRC
jgi:serine/threonine protein kinase